MFCSFRVTIFITLTRGWLPKQATKLLMNQQNKQRYLIRYLTIFAILISIVIVKTSCNKFDTNPNLLQQSKSYFVENFFTLKAPVNNDVKVIMQTLKNHQAKTGFINQLPHQYGMPIWQKSVKQINNSYASRGDTTTLNDGTIIVPFTITDSSISAILVAQPQGDTLKTFIYTKDHLYQAVHYDAFDKTFAESLLNLFLFMENKVYGKQQFYHIPNKFYSDSVQIGLDGKKIIQLEDQSNDSSSNLIFVRTCYYVYICGGQAVANWVAPKANESNVTHCWERVCTTVIIYPPPIPWPGGGTGPGGTGGGGPCGTCTPPPPPPNCNDPFYSFGPCGQPPPPPPPPPPPVPPCDTFINTLQNNVMFNNRISYLEQDSVFDKNVETGFTGLLGNNNSNQYIYAKGETVSGGIGTIDFYKLQYFPHGPVDVILHCHADNGAGVNLNSIFSPYDVIFMASNLLNGTNMYKNNANFAFVVTAKGFETNTGNPKTVTYMLKITDLQAFTNFAIANTGADGNDAKKMGKFVKKHNYKFITKNIPNSEREFLKMLKMNANGVGSGLSLYKADNASGSRKWSRPSLNGNTVNQTNCY